MQVENSAHKPPHAHGISKQTSKHSPWVKSIIAWCPCLVVSTMSRHCLVVYTRMTIVTRHFLISLFVRPNTSPHEAYQRAESKHTNGMSNHHDDSTPRGLSILPQRRVASLFRHLASSMSMPLRGLTFRSSQEPQLLRAHHRWPSARRQYSLKGPVP